MQPSCGRRDARVRPPAGYTAANRAAPAVSVAVNGTPAGVMHVAGAVTLWISTVLLVASTVETASSFITSRLCALTPRRGFRGRRAARS